MRATLDLQEKNGFFSKSWTVDCRIEFTADEHAAIKHGRLGSEVVFYTGSGDSRIRVTLGDVIINGGVRQTFTTLVAAQNDRRFIEDKLLPTIKGLISAGMNVGGGPRVIEL